MATRSLGTLTLDLIAKIGGFTSGLTQAERVADQKQRAIARKAKEQAKEVEQAWSSATKFVSGAFAGLTVVGLFSSFIRESKEASENQAQLAAVLKSTANAAGFTAEQLNTMAQGLAKVTSFGDDDFTKGQTALLKYTNIVGSTFTDALRLAGDMAARTGTSVAESADKIGKALNQPGEGLARLRREGVAFSDEQEKAIKILEETGRTAEAQALIIQGLERSYGGAAIALRQTFGGSLDALKAQLTDLMEGDDGSLESVRLAVEDLTATLGSQETKAAFAALTAGLANIVTGVVQAVSSLTRFAQFVGEGFARLVAGSADPIERLDEQITTLRGNIDLLQKGLAQAKPGTGAYEQQRAEVERLNKELQSLLATRADLSRQANNQVGETPSQKTPRAKPPSDDELRAIVAQQKAREEAEKAAERAAKQLDAYLEKLKAQLRATEDLTVRETVLRDLEEGRLPKINEAKRSQLLAIADQIDAEKRWQDEKKATLELFKKEDEASKRLQDQADSLAQSVETPIETLNRKLQELDELSRTNPFINGETLIRLNAKAWKEYADSVKTTKSELDQFGEKFAENVQQTLGGGLYDALTGNFKSIGDSFYRMITRMTADAAAAEIARTLFGVDENGKPKGNWLTGLKDYVDSIFSKLGGSSGAASSGGGSSLSGFFDQVGSFFGGIFGGARASGGPVMAGHDYIVGENGPELFRAKSSGMILPNDALRAGGGRVSNRFDLRGAVFGKGTNDRSSAEREAVLTARAIRREVERRSA